MNDAPVCPCDLFVHPQIITNPSGLSRIRYRVGDYTSFRQALLLARPDEIALRDWHPDPGNPSRPPLPGEDLALQLLEWWAYIADVLTFYNERAMEEALLRTAVVPEDVRRIIRLLGYRPRPGIGATGVVAALTQTQRPFVIPRGFAIEGPSAPDDSPQIFEVDQDVPIGTLGRRLPPSARFPSFPPGAGEVPTPIDARGNLIDQLPAEPLVTETLDVTAGSLTKFWLDGVVATLKPGDPLVVIRNDWDGIPYQGVPDAGSLGAFTPGLPDPVQNTSKDPVQFALLMVNQVTPTWDDKGHAVTELVLRAAHGLDPEALRRDYRLMRPTKFAHLWLYHVRYPGSTDASLLGASGFTSFVNDVANVAKDLANPFDALGKLFGGGGPPPPPPQDPRVLAVPTVSTDPLPPHGAAHLEAITRGIKAGDPVMFEQRMPLPPSDGSGGIPGGGDIAGLVPGLPNGITGLFNQIENAAKAAFGVGLPEPSLNSLPDTRAQVVQLVKVTGYTEEIWYANAPDMNQIGRGPPVGPPAQSSGGGGNVLSSVTGGLLGGGGGGGGGEGPIPIPHSKITFAPNPILANMAQGDQGLSSIVVHYAFQPVGDLVPPPPAKTTTKVGASSTTDGTPPDGTPVLIEGTGTGGTPATLGTTVTVTGEPLVPPLRALLNLLPVSRGQTVDAEVLGSGDPTAAGQEFVLGRSPLTYLADTSPGSIDGYRSTLSIRVDGIEWREVPSFYGQPRDARVFVTREDDDQKTHVRFGDGENGARLPAGTDNVVAQYRIGSGARVPPSGTLTAILKPLSGLRAIRNPIAVGGGADPDPPEQIRRYAPRSVLTFGRAISGDDYETAAAQTPGVRRARVYWSWDGASQRTVVKVFVGDDDAAVVAARAALQAFADPNRPALVALAAPIYPGVSLTVEVDRAYEPDAVAAAVRVALQDPQQQPFGSDVVQIGQIVYDSNIYDACLRVPGVTAVRGLRFQLLVTRIGRFGEVDRWFLERGHRHSPGEGGFYLLRPDRLQVAAEVARHGR